MKEADVEMLIADDHPLFRSGLKHVVQFQLSGRIVEAADGKSALKFIQELRPRLCILDINMPSLDGLSVVRRMREQRLPGEIIFLTMHKEEDLFASALDLGVKGYVLKDGAVDEIIDCIRTVTLGRRYISPALTDYLLNRQAKAHALAQKQPGLARLTPAERRILKLIAHGRTSKEIADELGLSTRTVENHRTNICSKLDVHGIHGLVKFAYDIKSSL